MEVPHGCGPFGRASPGSCENQISKGSIIPGKGAPEGRTSVNMQDRELYRRILGIEPWQVERVELKLETGEVHIYLDHAADVTWSCPECSAPSPLYDHQPERCWRHLDTCQYRTILHVTRRLPNAPSTG